jgi:hypothetical protein
MLKTFSLVLVTEKTSDGLQEFIRADQVFFKHEERFIEAVAETLHDLKEPRKKNLFCCDAIGKFHPLPKNAKLFILMEV